MIILDDFDGILQELQDLKLLMDSSDGGQSNNDLIIDEPSQQQILAIINGIISSYEIATVPAGIHEISSIELIESVIDDLTSIMSANPGTPLADKVEDALATTQNALSELTKISPDPTAAASLGSIESAIGSLEDAIKDSGLGQDQGENLINKLLDASRQLATEAITLATDTPGSDEGKISSANTALANGDSLREDPTSFGDFKDAAAEYKVAIADAESALP